MVMMDEELYNLIKKLRDEASFVQSEKRHLLDLYKQLIKKSDHLFNKEWVISSQYAILEDLIMGRANKITMSQTCARYALSPARTHYVESHKQFGHHDYYVGEFLKGLRERPVHLAKLIVRSEKYSSMSASLSSMLLASGPGGGSVQLLPGVDNQYFSTQRLVKAAFHSLYGNCLLIQDECLCLQLMKHLLEHQFGVVMNGDDQNNTTTNVDLRRLIRRQSCSFNIIFKLYMTFSHSSQLFLTAALYEPIAKMLNDEWYLDIEPDKALARFSNEDIIAKFGHPSSKEYKLKTQKYREKIVNALYSITMSFVESISMSLFCFPASLSWLVHQMYKIINKAHAKSQQQPPGGGEMARKLCCDLIMAIYICPVICDPEPYGVVSDVQISNVARHNLMQVANVLQVLAMSEEDKDTRAHDLYSKFKPNCVSDILNTIILTPNHQHLGIGMSQNGISTTVTTNNNNNNTANNASNYQVKNTNMFYDPQLLSVSQLDLLDIGSTNPAASNLSTCSSNLLVNNNNNNNSQLASSSNSQLLARNSILMSTQDVHRLIIYCSQMCKTMTSDPLVDWLRPLIPSDYLSSTLETACASLNNNNNKPRQPHTSSGASISPIQSVVVYTIQSPEVVDSLLRESLNLDGSSNNKVLIVNINDKSLECPGMLSEEKFLSEQSRHFHHHHQYNRHDISSSASSAASFYFNQKTSKTNRSHHHHHHHHQSGGGSLKRGSTLQANGGGGVNNQAGNQTDRNNDEDDDEVGQAVDDDDDDDDDDEIEDVDEANQMMMMRAGVDADEDEVDDGLSDFDNLSNRDTPIVSGRDTPSSNSHDDLLNTSRTPGGGHGHGHGHGQSSSSQNGTHSAINSSSMNVNSQINSGQSTISGGGGIGYTSLNATRGPSLPVTVQKPNREDINDKFCKFEINKVPATMSETGWSLDADPPESVANEPINDRLGLDETSVISVSSSVASNNRSSNNKSTNLVISKQISQNSNASSTSQYNNNNNTSSTQSTTATDSAIQSSSSNLINFGDQDLNSVTSANSLHQKSSVDNQITLNASGGGLNPAASVGEDSASVVSDSVAWSTDVINNSDNSDLESSNSPSKYTPYSTYSSYSSNQHQLLNQSLLSELAAVAAAASSSVTSQPSLTSVHSASNSINTNNNNKKEQQASESGLGSSHSQSDNHLAVNSQSQTTSHSNPGSATKHKLSSIFSSNTNSVKFSFGGGGGSQATNNSSNNTPNNSKRNALQRIFPFNKSKNNATQQSSSSTTAVESSNQAAASITPTEASQSDNIDSILKKYTKTAVVVATTATTPQNQSSNSEGILIDLTEETAVASSPAADNPVKQEATTGNNLLAKNLSSASLQQQKNNLLYYDPENLEQSKLFLDAKKKLRLVFGWSDYCIYQLGGYTLYNRSPKDNYLTIYLKTQLYDVIRLQDKEKEAQLYETLRCISIFSESECNKLLRSLKRDYLKRIYYMTYLTKSKQNLLQSLQFVDKMTQRAESDQKLFTHHFATVVTRLFLETKENEHQMYKFVSDFKQLVAIDEKFDLIRSFLGVLKKDYDSVWSTTRLILTNNTSSNEQADEQDIVKLGHLCLERLLFSRVYSFVMFPNGEIDQYRDTKFSECLTELAASITPSHPLIGISDIYLNECPWIAAQIELKRLNLYKTPQDKLSCIRKCMLTIQNLLAIAKSPVCADDMHPVLIYVIIKANPSTFLSNVQYIEGFYGSQLESEDYYWAQFKFAYSYIKAKMLANTQQQ